MRSVKYIVIIVLALMSANVYSQRYLDAQIRRPDDYRQKVRLGIRAGVNISDLTSAKGLDIYNGLAYFNLNKDYIGFTDTKAKVGFNFGISAQAKLRGYWWLEASLLYTTKGYELNTQNVEIDATAHYIQLPVSVMYKFPAGDLDLIASIGGFLGVGVYGYTDFEDHYGQEEKPRTAHQDIQEPYINEDLGTTNLIGCDYTVHGAGVYWADRDDTFLSDGTYRVDGGLLLGLGLEYRRFQFMFNYQFSLTFLYDYGRDFSSRYDYRATQGGLGDRYAGYHNSFEYFNIDIPTAPRQHVLSFSITYFFDSWKHGLKI